MPPHRTTKNSRPSQRRGAVRTDGAPRLIDPRGPGNRASDNFAIFWSDGGRSKRISTGTDDKAIAETVLARFCNARSVSARLVTVNDVLDADIKRKADDHARTVRATKLLRSRISALKPIRAHFGALNPEMIEPNYIDDYIDKRRASVSDRTVSIELAYFRAALKHALDKKRITAAPAITLPQARAKARRRTLKRAEMERLVEAISAPETPLHLRGFVALSVFTGQRGVHVRALKWEHVDFDEGQIYFTLSNPHAAENKQCEDIPIARALLPYLIELREAARSTSVIEWDGKPVLSLKRAWANLIKRADLADLHVHDLRRSFATIAARAGAKLGDVAALMNLDEKTLRRHYAHGAPERVRALIERIGGSDDT